MISQTTSTKFPLTLVVLAESGGTGILLKIKVCFLFVENQWP